MGWRETKLPGSSSAANCRNEEKDRQGTYMKASFDAEEYRRSIDTLIAKMRQHNPGGDCWQWVQQNLNDKWRQLMQSLREIDAAFERQHRTQVQQAINRTGQLYQECVSAWRRAAGS
ncbi:hypothetical protein [Geotalea toluenoxydans]|uniref:hypothetical protein n=1 Tax=Geotalea toluenoxydans TaxID=421624 RepID=UPI0006D14597|nr:hypothetical protein [Geotalea toluenoxydans]